MYFGELIKQMTRSTLIYFLCFTLNWCLASEVDSLKNEYKRESNDSLKARIALKIGDYFEDIKIEESIIWGEKAIEHSINFNDDLFKVKVLNYASSFYYRKGDYQSQITLCHQALKISELNDFFEQQGSIASNIGSAYVRLEDSIQAIKWLTESIDLKEKYSTPIKLAYSITNLGSYYFDIGNFEEAAICFEKSLAIRKASDNDESIAINLANLADCYMVLEEYNKAEKLFSEAIAINKKINDQYGVSKVMLDFSYLYDRMENYPKAIIYADSANNLAQSLSYKELHHDAIYQLAGLYSKTGQNKKAFEFQKIAYDLWQELHTEESTQNLNELRTQYQTEKLEKDGEIKDLNLKRNKEQISSQRMVIGTAIGGLFILVILVYFLNKWNKDKREKNTLLKEQKLLVETKNREILDSIEYAKRIQAAILPPTSEVNELLPNNFVLYQPKDVVAGDFYWVEKQGDKILFAAADCTGHGVPGAMVSVVCNNALNRSVREYGLSDPGKILDKTRFIVLEEFEKSEDEVSDGMDIALCSIEGSKLEYAGAHNPLWLIRKGELIEIKANKQPIGRFAKAVEYITHAMDLQKEDTVYLFSDGFADQFGGERNKKYKSANFKKFLLSIQDLNMNDQFEAIRIEFDKWKGEFEQLDDVCVFGVRI